MLSVLSGFILLGAIFWVFRYWWLIICARRGYRAVTELMGKKYARGLSIETLAEIGNPFNR